MSKDYYDQRRGSSTQRGYGSRWQRARAAHLKLYPLCVMCEREGRVTAATVVDHKIAHKGDDALFWDQANWQSLCKPHHDREKQIEERATGAQTHPDWLPVPKCPVVLVTGPPASGKTTYCREHAKPGDVVVDLDECFYAVCGVHGHTADRKYLGAAIRHRNSLLAKLGSKTSGNAFVIVGSPSAKEVEWWTSKLKAEHVRLDPGLNVCLSRLSRQRSSVVVRDWYAKAKANSWTPPKTTPKTQSVGVDGWPI